MHEPDMVEAKSCLTFLVSYCGVATSLIGLSAHGLEAEGAVVVIMYGDLVRNSPIRMGITKSRGLLKRPWLAIVMMELLGRQGGKMVIHKRT